VCGLYIVAVLLHLLRGFSHVLSGAGSVADVGSDRQLVLSAVSVLSCLLRTEQCMSVSVSLLVSVCQSFSSTLPYVSFLAPSILHLSRGFQCSPTLNRQPYGGRLPLTSWWKKLSHDSWPIQPDILNPPLLRLTSTWFPGCQS